MKKTAIIVSVLLGGFWIFSLFNQPHKPTAKAATSTSTTSAACTLHGELPDPICTPGDVNPAVTQANISTTICKQGWTKTVRPSISYTAMLKHQSIKDYGYKDTSPKLYEEDHLIPLELGGSPDSVKNLWAEPAPSPNKKDDVEYALNRSVCNGSMTLSEAQHRIATNWTTATK